jgi:hypothetical protein
MDFKKQFAGRSRSSGSAEHEEFVAAVINIGDIAIRVHTTASSIEDPELRKRLTERCLSVLRLRDDALAVKDRPPRSAQFALLLLPKRNREHLIGDLEEEFRTIVLPQYGRFLAGCWYCEQVGLAIVYYAWPTLKKILGLSFLYKLIGR